MGESAHSGGFGGSSSATGGTGSSTSAGKGAAPGMGSKSAADAAAARGATGNMAALGFDPKNAYDRQAYAMTVNARSRNNTFGRNVGWTDSIHNPTLKNLAVGVDNGLPGAIGILAGLVTGNPAIAALGNILGRLAVGKLKGETPAESTGPMIMDMGLGLPLQVAGGYLGNLVGDAPGGILGQKVGAWAGGKVLGMTPTANENDTGTIQNISDNNGGPKFINWSRRLS